MKFFIPAADSPEQEQRVYGSIKNFLGKELGARFSDSRIYSLRWWLDGIKYFAEVGKPTHFNSETVVAILHEPGRNVYHVCTGNRGVLRGMPILASSLRAERVDFDYEKPTRAKPKRKPHTGRHKRKSPPK